MKAVLLAGGLGMVYRHPFLGPGLGVRILGEVKSEFSDLLRREAIDLCSFIVTNIATQNSSYEFS